MNQSGEPVATAQLQQQIDALLQQHLKGLLSGFAPESLGWLALPPVWTEALAQKCSFPTTGEPLSAFLTRASAAGFCKRDRAPRRAQPGSASFSMPNHVRPTVLDALRHDPERGAAWLLQQVHTIGQRVAEARKSDPSLACPDVLARWSELAGEATNSLNANNWLSTRIDTLVNTAQTSAASAWIDTGAALANTFGGALGGTVRLGERRLELVYRQREQERYLKDYQDRPELIAPFEELISPHTEFHALHYLGMGGVGKTMLLRYISGKIARERHIPVTRIDFDHLSPDYPVGRPGQLLLELAAELRAFSTSTQDEQKFTQLRIANDELMEKLSAERAPADPLANIRRPEFDRVVRVFCDMLRLISGGDIVILILDTCEELARVTLAGGRRPSLEATLEILERVYDYAPSTRIVFAGRRIIATPGDEPADSNTTRRYRSKLGRKDYLRVTQVRGFTEAEALEYLQRKQLKLTDPAREAVLDRSREQHTSFQDSATRHAQARYNPFDLSLYADWIAENPDVAAEEIMSAAIDPYVEVRIIRPLQNSAIRPLLPAVVLLQRFNAAMLRPVLASLSDVEFEDTYRMLADQEWIEVGPGDSLLEMFLEVKRNLVARLRRYFGAPERKLALQCAAEQIAQPLAERVRTIALGDLPFEHLNAALALLPLQAAAGLLDDLMARVAGNPDWNWVWQVAGRLLGEGSPHESHERSAHGGAKPALSLLPRLLQKQFLDGAEFGAAVDWHPQLRSGLLAIFNAAALHVGSPLSLEDSWREVAEWSAVYPDEAAAPYLRARALTGHLKEQCRIGRTLQGLAQFRELFHRLTPVPKSSPCRSRSEDLLASVCGLLLAMDDARGKPATLLYEQDSGQYVARKLNALTREGYPEELIDFIAVLTISTPTEWDRLGQKYARRENVPSLQRWSDWLVPEPFADHMWLRILNANPLLTLLPPPFASVMILTKGRLGSIESERLASLALQKLMRISVPDAQMLRTLSIAEQVAYHPERQPLCRLHEEIPPLFVTIARGLRSAGFPAEAHSLLQDRLRKAESTKSDARTIAAAQLATLQFARRMRVWLRDTVSVYEDSRLQGEQMVVAALCGPGAASFQVPANTDDPVLAHGWFAAQQALTAEELRQLITRATRMFGSIPGGYRKPTPPSLALLADWDELHYLNRRSFAPSWSPPAQPPAVFSDDELRTILRQMYLNTAIQPAQLERMLAPSGVRHLAGLAFEEGEVLSLRIPTAGAQLLEWSADHYQQCEDWLGVWQSSIRAAIAHVHAGTLDRMRAVLARYTRSAHRKIANALSIPPWEKLGSEPWTWSIEDAPDPWSGWVRRLELCRCLEQFRTEKEAASALRPRSPAFETPLSVELNALPGLAEPVRKAAVATPTGSSRLKWLYRGASSFGHSLSNLAMLAVLLLIFFSGSFVGGSGLSPELSRISTWSVSIVALLLTLTVTNLVLRGTDQESESGWVNMLLELSVIAFLTVMYWGSGLLLTRATGHTPSREWQAAALIAIAALMAAFPGFARWVVSQINPLLALTCPCRLEIEVPSRATSPYAPVSFSLRFFIRRTSIHLSRRLLETAQVRSQASGGHLPILERYASIAPVADKMVDQALHDLRTALGSRRKTIRFQDPYAAPAWEAMLAARDVSNTAAPDPLIFVRTTYDPAEGLPPAPRWKQWLHLPSAAIVSNTWSSFLQEAWSAAGERINTFENPLHISHRLPLKVLHLVGTPTLASNGVRLEIDPRSDTPAIASSRTGMRVGLSNMPKAEAIMVIVQAEPADSKARVGSDREQAALLRQFSRDICNAGTPFVITVPTLPPALAAATIRDIAQAWKEGGGGRNLFAHVLERSRRRVLKFYATHAAGDPSDRWEAAYDLCLMEGTTIADRQARRPH